MNIHKLSLNKVIRYFLIEFLTLIAILGALPLVNKLSITNAYLYGPQSSDGAAFPQPVVPCLNTPDGRGIRDPEFHSLRPYQASPCGISPQLYFCDNTYNILEDVSMRWDPNLCRYMRTSTGPGAYVCSPPANAEVNGKSTYIIGGQDGRDYEITISNVDYPFLGYTEDEVTNSQSQIENLDDATKMNEYVNWYLQGTIEKAEYGDNYPENFNAYAGPTKKLVPFDLLNIQRLRMLHQASVDLETEVDLLTYQGPSDLLKVDENTGEATTNQTFNHNHIAVCTAFGTPIPCWNNRDPSEPASGDPKRLADWWERRGSRQWETYNKSVGNWLKNWQIYNVWRGVTPPFPWQFVDENKYRKALMEWAGRTCIVLPFTTTFSCGPGLPNVYSENYEYIPLGNASDKNGLHLVLGLTPRISGDKSKVKILDYEIASRPVLHYPHTESTVQVADLLNDIHTPLECEETPGKTPLLPGEGKSCCADGYTYTLGACTNNKLIASCNGFGSTVCGAINAIQPGACNSSLMSNACVSAALMPEFVTDNSSAICAQILTATGTGVFGEPALIACKAGIQILYGAVSSLNLSIPESCMDGLICNNLGFCSNPNTDVDLKCKRIEGKGKGYEPTTCEFGQVRTNLGDSLTFESPASFLQVIDVMTEVEQIECENTGDFDTFFAPTPQGCGGNVYNSCFTELCVPYQCGGYCPTEGLLPGLCTNYPMCQAKVTITIPTLPKIPYADEIWEQTIVNENSSFRRIFPKIEEGAPVECIAEIPGYSNADYITNPETNLNSVTTAGPHYFGGAGAGAITQGQLFFPHLGTIYEYFLKGIQSALRPKEFGGGPIPSANIISCAESEVISDCKQWLFEQDTNGQKYFEKVIQAANNTSCNGKHLNPFWAMAIGLNENGALYSSHINGDGATHFGCNPCEIQTIDEKIACMTNTLRAGCASGLSDTEILQNYGYDPSYQMGPLEVLTGAGKPYPPLFGTDFNTGILLSNLMATNWKAYYPETPELCAWPPVLPAMCY